MIPKFLPQCAICALPLLLAVSCTPIDRSNDVASSPTQSDAPVSAPEAPTTEVEPEPGSQWTYQVDDDAMGKGKAHLAFLESTNTVQLELPYSGEQHATLIVRTHPRYGKDVILKIERGQFLGSSFQESKVLVRFDELEARSYNAIGAEDNSSETLFLRGYDRFMAGLKKARKVRLSAAVFQEGSPVFEFDVSGFDSNKYIPK